MKLASFYSWVGVAIFTASSCAGDILTCIDTANVYCNPSAPLDYPEQPNVRVHLDVAPPGGRWSFDPNTLVTVGRVDWDGQQLIDEAGIAHPAVWVTFNTRRDVAVPDGAAIGDSYQLFDALQNANLITLTVGEATAGPLELTVTSLPAVPYQLCRASCDDEQVHEVPRLPHYSMRANRMALLQINLVDSEGNETDGAGDIMIGTEPVQSFIVPNIDIDVPEGELLEHWPYGNDVALGDDYVQRIRVYMWDPATVGPPTTHDFDIDAGDAVFRRLPEGMFSLCRDTAAGTCNHTNRDQWNPDRTWD